MRRKLLFQVSRIPLKALERETGNGKRGTINGGILNSGASFLPFFLAAQDEMAYMSTNAY